MNWRGLLVAALSLAWATGAPALDGDRYRYADIERVVAFGDVHGAYDALVTLLEGTGVIDADGVWSGGRTHLVSTGDLLSRGDQERQVLDLLMRLEREAAAAGGRVHVLLGNHEVMTLTGDLRYVSDGGYASFGGRAERRAAFAPTGRYGRWLLDKPVMIVIDDTLFVHGGLSRHLLGLTLEQINDAARHDLWQVVTALHALEPRATDDTRDGFGRVRAKGNPAVQDALRGLPFHPDGPLWYRGTALCHPYAEAAVTAAVLDGLGALRVAVGHTVTHDRRITRRMDGLVYKMDTGMNARAYGGRPAALMIEPGSVRVFDLEQGLVAAEPEPNRVWNRPYGMSDEEIEAFLRDGTIVGSEVLGEGVTLPKRMTLEKDGRTIRALFKTEDTHPAIVRERWSRRSENADRYAYDYAAYRIDRMLDLQMVPVSVLRVVDGDPGVMTLWIEGAFNENRRRERGMVFDGHCNLQAQYNLMNVFDVLVHNVDRSLGNILYDTAWMVWLIDHTRAFRTHRGVPPMLARSTVTVTPQMATALDGITREALRELEPYLHRRQIQALLDRARTLQDP